jgi:hypothetical protein
MMMLLLNFMTAVYWGQLSHCETLDISVSQYSCSNTVAYGAVSAFSVLLFLVQLPFTAMVVLYRGELISDPSMYDDISTSSTHSIPGFSPYEHINTNSGGNASGQYAAPPPPPPSADL